MSRRVYDVAIIGAGVIGSSLARCLSQYQLEVLVLEAADDVGTGATRANSGIVHGGYASKAGTRKAEFSRAGNLLFDQLARELNFPFRRLASVVLAFHKDDFDILEEIRINGIENGVHDLEILGKEDVLSRVPRLNPSTVKGALFCPSSGIVSPYEYTIALAENAAANDVQFRLNSPLRAMEPEGDTLRLETGAGVYRSRFVVNAAGLGTGRVAELVGAAPFRTKPRRGEYVVFRRGTGEDLDAVVFQPPSEKGKGPLVTPTVWGNLLVGPNALDVEDEADTGTNPETLAHLIRTASRGVRDIDMKLAIRVFAGVRPVSTRSDFILEWSDCCPGLLHLGGIESPGITASPTLALEAVRMLNKEGLLLKKKTNFRFSRPALTMPGPLASPSLVHKDTLLKEGNPERIVCRCEQVREAVIQDALSREIPIQSMDAVKRRTRAGMGACQGAFCGSRVRALIAKHQDMEVSMVTEPTRTRETIQNTLKAVQKILSTPL